MTHNAALARFISQRLKASVDLAAHVSTRIYHVDNVPSTPVMPYVVFQLMPDRPRLYVSKSSQTRAGHIVRIIGIQISVRGDQDGSLQVCHDADEDVRAAVQVMGTVGGYHIHPPTNTQSFETIYPEANRRYPSVVSLFSAIVSGPPS